MIQVHVHIYRISAIYCDIVIGHNMHYRGCASYYYSDNCNTCYSTSFQLSWPMECCGAIDNAVDNM